MMNPAEFLLSRVAIVFRLDPWRRRKEIKADLARAEELVWIFRSRAQA